jgi:uncharacterized protein involved in type VI secretion and phage assembly
MAGSRRGVQFIPEEGDEVLVAFERGDLRVPYVVGSLWSGTSPPPVSNADGRNDVRLIRTRSGHTLTFDDSSTGRVQLQLNDGKRLSIDQEKITLQDQSGNGVTIESGSGAVTVHSAGRLLLEAPQISLEASGTIEIKAAGPLTLRGAVVHIN